MGRAIVFRSLGALLLLLPLLIVSAPATRAEPRIEITQTTTPGEYKFDVRGFFDEEDVSTWLTGPSQQVMESGIYSTDDRGRVDFRLRMPRHFQPGRWAITVHGLRSDREVIGYFEVPLLGPNATLTLNAGSLRNGETLIVTSEDFGRSERISFWFTGPDGRVVAGAYYLSSTRQGQVALTYYLNGFQPGGWAITLYGNESDRLGVATFEVV